MSDQTTYISFSGIGEIEFVVRRKDWYKCDATEFNADKTIPFIKLLIDLVGAGTKCYLNQTRLERYENYPRLAKDIMKTATRLSCSFIKIKKLSDDMFRIGDIQTIDYCLEVYRQYTSGKRLDSFLLNAWEIERTLSLLQPELIEFKKDKIKFFRQIKKLIRKDSIAKKIINNLTSYKLQRMFIMDLEKQFRKVIIKGSKYKSDFCQYFREIESLDEKPVFIERILS